MRRRIGIAAAICCVLVLSAPPAMARIDGPCDATIADSSMADGYDTPSSALKVALTEEISVSGKVTRGSATSVDYFVNLAGVRVKAKSFTPGADSSWAGTVPVAKYAWASVGLFEVKGVASTTAGPCTGVAYVCVTGKSLFTTAAGGLGSLFGLGGLIALVTGMSKRSGLLRLLWPGLLIGAGIALLMQQACLAPLTPLTIGVMPVVAGAISMLGKPLLGIIDAPASRPETETEPDDGTWRPTHQAPSAGLGAWTSPDPNVQASSQLGAGTPLVVVERTGAWANVRGVNGWTGWVDDRLLQPIADGRKTGGSRWMGAAASAAFSVILAALVFLGVRVFAGGPAPAKFDDRPSVPSIAAATPDVTAPTTRHIADDPTGMGLDVPVLWRDERDPATGMLIVFDPATSADGRGAAAEVRLRLLRQDPEPGDLGTLVTQRLRNEPSYRQISAGPFSVDARSGFRHEFDVEINGLAVRVIEVWLPLPDRMVWLSAIATPARQVSALQQFDEVVASLRVAR